MLTSKKIYIKALSCFIFLNTVFCVSCTNVTVKPDPTARLTILYTNDEHGWMEATKRSGGAAGLMGLWKEKDGYTEDGPYLVLSGGDLWTGPAISTWTRGESMTEVLNAMGYDAATIGNHEFDWKIEGLKERIAQAEFPLLSANIKDKETGAQADFATPYIIREVNGIKVGIIGLTTTDTPTSTFPDNVEDYDFIPYADALYEYVPQVKEDGAELLVVAGHFGQLEMEELVPVAKELGISIIGGGHSHQRVNEMIDGVAIIEAGGRMSHYGKIEVLFDTVADTVIKLTQELLKNEGGTLDPEIVSIISYWRSKVDSSLSQVIGYVNQDINQSSDAMRNMIMDSWLEMFPSADVSMTNSGGIRQSILKGEITLEDIIGVLPFENNIVELDLTGSELIDCMGRFLVGGIASKTNRLLSDGTSIHPDSIYRVLTIDYLYSREDTPFHKYDPDPENTSINYRQPVIDWIKSVNTTADNPLDLYLDHKSRK
ncbi:MAG TPA: hypothetical protein DHW42_04890 [Candidatus Marinimicrobia bacterium]|nr:hypothetical protein [Candidatus Neomarinimicrobiota bacterium]